MISGFEIIQTYQKVLQSSHIGPRLSLTYQSSPTRITNEAAQLDVDVPRICCYKVVQSQLAALKYQSMKDSMKDARLSISGLAAKHLFNAILFIIWGQMDKHSWYITHVSTVFMASASILITPPPMIRVPLVPQRVGQHVGVQNQREADSRKSIHRPLGIWGFGEKSNQNLRWNEGCLSEAMCFILVYSIETTFFTIVLAYICLVWYTRRKKKQDVCVQPPWGYRRILRFKNNTRLDDVFVVSNLWDLLYRPRLNQQSRGNTESHV